MPGPNFYKLEYAGRHVPDSPATLPPHAAVSVAMVFLRALLFGDIATLNFPARSDSYRDDDDGDDDGQEELKGRKGLGYILERSFGKVG